MLPHSMSALQSAMCLRLRTLAAEAGEGNRNSPVIELEGQLQAISHDSWEGAWLPKRATCALSCLVTACALRPGVDLKQALTVLQRGLDFTQQGLDAEGVTLEVWSEPLLQH